MIEKIVSGGQTGADRGALEAALEAGFAYSGWVPKGRKSADGQVPACFDQLQEHPSPDYPPRTYANVRDSDATVIFCKSAPLSGGSKLTLRYCREQDRLVRVYGPSLLVTLKDQEETGDSIRAWAAANEIKVLNVAGNRESVWPGLQARVKNVIARAIERKDS